MTDRQIPPPLSSEELRAKIKSGELKIVSAPREQVIRYDEEIQALLIMLGHEEAYVTDESTLGDLMGCLDVQRHANLNQELGFSVSRSDYLCDIAAKMRGVQ